MSKPAPDTGSVADRTRELLGSLSPGERKVARALLAAYPVAGLETVADLLSDSRLRITLLDLGKRDLMVVFDYRRYDADVVEVARRANKNGARVVLFADPWLSPAAEFAAVVIPAQVEAVGPFDSLAPAMSIVETMVAAVNIRLARTSRERITRLEA